jgi:hypothetical protein
MPQGWRLAADCSPQNLGFNPMRFHTKFFVAGSGFIPTFSVFPRRLLFLYGHRSQTTEMSSTCDQALRYHIPSAGNLVGNFSRNIFNLFCTLTSLLLHVYL